MGNTIEQTDRLVFSVHVSNEIQSVAVQKKMLRMGFKTQLGGDKPISGIVQTNIEPVVSGNDLAQRRIKELESILNEIEEGLFDAFVAEYKRQRKDIYHAVTISSKPRECVENINWGIDWMVSLKGEDYWHEVWKR